MIDRSLEPSGIMLHWIVATQAEIEDQPGEAARRLAGIAAEEPDAWLRVITVIDGGPFTLNDGRVAFRGTYTNRSGARSQLEMPRSRYLMAIREFLITTFDGSACSDRII